MPACSAKRASGRRAVLWTMHVGPWVWDKPVPKACPACNAPYLVEKTTKKKGTRLLCQAEGCGFEEAVEEGATA